MNFSIRCNVKTRITEVDDSKPAYLGGPLSDVSVLLHPHTGGNSDLWLVTYISYNCLAHSVLVLSKKIKF